MHYPRLKLIVSPARGAEISRAWRASSSILAARYSRSSGAESQFRFTTTFGAGAATGAGAGSAATGAAATGAAAAGGVESAGALHAATPTMIVKYFKERSIRMWPLYRMFGVCSSRKIRGGRVPLLPSRVVLVARVGQSPNGLSASFIHLADFGGTLRRRECSQ